MYYLTCPNLALLPNIRHGFFTRKDGVSSGIYASLNCGPGSGDVLEHIFYNRAKVTNALEQKAESLITCHQIHSAEVITIDKIWQHKDAPKADSMVTNQPNIALGILTADCMPVLFADSKAGIIGAAHAGWKGAANGVLENTIAAMEALGALRQNITATIGPAIAQSSYEVGAEFRDHFLKQNTDNNKYFIPSTRNGHFLFDLKNYGRDCLNASGIDVINLLEKDTCLEEDSFFSFRRATLKNEPSYGRQISVIVKEK